MNQEPSNNNSSHSRAPQNRQSITTDDMHGITPCLLFLLALLSNLKPMLTIIGLEMSELEMLKIKNNWVQDLNKKSFTEEQIQAFFDDIREYEENNGFYNDILVANTLITQGEDTPNGHSIPPFESAYEILHSNISKTDSLSGQQLQRCSNYINI